MKGFTCLLTILCLSTFASLDGQVGYRIEVELNNYDQQELYLGYYFGNNTYLNDTARLNANGRFVFEGEEPLAGGVYLLVMAPDNQYFQILVDPDNQKFSLKGTAPDPTADVQFEGSIDNNLFYDYLRFLGDRRPQAEKLRADIEAEIDPGKKAALTSELEDITQSVVERQEAIMRDHPRTLTAAIVRANRSVQMPEFDGTEEEQTMKRWYYTRNHYFDDVDLSDPRLLRTPFLFQRIEDYVTKLHYQHPDSIVQAIDTVLQRARPAEETFKYYLIHFLNKYAASEIVGMDAVYVHLAKNYYGKGLATWSDEENVERILKNAKELEPTLIGKMAPDIQLQKRDGSTFNLHDIEAAYTVLYFWRYDCGHCKESTPHMKAFYESFKDKGVELVAVCFKASADIPNCWDYIDENEIGNWTHGVDPYYRSQFPQKYNLKTTPQIFVLDKDKVIRSKRIGAKQLEEVVQEIMNFDAEQDSAESGRR